MRKPSTRAAKRDGHAPLSKGAPVRRIGVIVVVAVVVLSLGGLLTYTLRSRPHFEMAATLASFVSNEGTWDNEWDKPQEKIQSVLALINSERDPAKRFELRRELAQRYVIANASEAALSTLEDLQKEVGKTVPAAYSEILKADMAFAYFRMGEIQNCTWNHNSDSCLFPIQGEGVHKQQMGASEAARIYGELLADPQTNAENVLVYRWLLNMTLGQYPEKVPKRWLIPPETFKSDYDIGQFRDVSITRGVNDFGAAGGVILEDFDNDGHLDLMISHMGIGDQLEYFHNNGDGTFTRMTDKAGLTGIVGGLNILQADYNNDGCIDVLVLRGAWLHDKGKWPPSLLRNNCDGTFTDVTAEAGLLYYYPTHTAAWADVNNDGLLDLFVGHEIDRAHVAWPPGSKNFELLLNNGDGTFREVGAQSGIHLDGFVKGAVFADYDNDGRQDLYVTKWGGGNQLFRNSGVDGSGIPKFVDVTRQAGVAEPNKSFTTWFFDYNNDGWPDIFVSGYSASLPDIVREYLGDKEHTKGERARLYRNNKDGTFTDVSREVGLDKQLLTMGANFGDLDNDGWLDFYLGTGDPRLTSLVPNRMFRNAEGKYFQDVSTSGGFGHLQKGHGVAFGDIDNTGNQDIFEVMGGVYPNDKFWSVLYKNPGHGNHWFKLRLIGVKANRFGVGARIRVDITEDGIRRQIYRDVTSGGSFGASSLRPHSGVGKATTIDAIEIRWPGSGSVQRFEGPIGVDRTYELTEGKPALKPVEASPKLAARVGN